MQAGLEQIRDLLHSRAEALETQLRAVRQERDTLRARSQALSSAAAREAERSRELGREMEALEPQLRASVHGREQPAESARRASRGPSLRPEGALHPAVAAATALREELDALRADAACEEELARLRTEVAVQRQLRATLEARLSEEDARARDLMEEFW